MQIVKVTGFKELKQTEVVANAVSKYTLYYDSLLEYVNKS